VKVLVIDDDEGVRKFIQSLLSRHDIASVCEADSGAAMKRLIGQGGFDVVLLDVEMPGQSGWEFLDKVRAAGDETPVIFLTGHKTQEERVKGLRLGADDYITKPFDSRELLARLEAVVRRGKSLPVVVLGDLKINLGRRTVERNEQRIDLSPREFDVLWALVEARGGVVSRAELLRQVWGMDFDPGTKVVEVQIARLRSKIDRNAPPLIHTLVGEGYCIKLPEEVSPESSQS